MHLIRKFGLHCDGAASVYFFLLFSFFLFLFQKNIKRFYFIYSCMRVKKVDLIQNEKRFEILFVQFEVKFFSCKLDKIINFCTQKSCTILLRCCRRHLHLYTCMQANTHEESKAKKKEKSSNKSTLL